ncbi:MAG: bifunctional diguanylate cyclase/phosphodiesterase, partial [Ferruginibacter sp.]
MNFNKHLEKQIEQYLDDDCLKQEQVIRFINAVNNSYDNFEEDQTLSSHAFKIHEQEFTMINDQPKEEIETRPQGLISHSEAITNVEDITENTSDVHNPEVFQPCSFDYLDEQIIKQKKVERELQNSEYQLSAAASRLSQLITNLNNGILLEDENRNIILTNQLYCDMFMITASPESISGKNCMYSEEQFKHLFKYPEDFIARIGILLNNKKLVIGDELEMNDGRVLVRDFIPIYVANEYKGHLWKYIDVTAENEKENELKRLSLVASANENGVGFCDAFGVLNWVNEGFTKLTGYPTEEIIGKKAVELCMGPLSDMNTIKEMLEAFYTGKGFNIEVIHYRKDGSWFWGRLRGQSILDEKGNVKQYFAMVDDITGEKEKEEQLRVLSLIAEDNINAVIITDAAGCINWVNKSFVKITGYTLQEVKGKKPGM